MVKKEGEILRVNIAAKSRDAFANNLNVLTLNYLLHNFIGAV